MLCIRVCENNLPAGLTFLCLLSTESIRRLTDKQSIKFVRAVKQDTKNGRSEDRILVRPLHNQTLLMEVTFNFLEIRAMNTYPDHQVVIDTDKSTHSLRLQSQDHLDHMMNHVNYALSRIFNNSMYAPAICRTEGDVSDGVQKFSPNSESSVETQKTCGGFSETYAALCDYNGIGCKEEVQWDVDTIYHSQDNREFNLLDFSHLDSRDLAVMVASMAYNTWFTKLYCKDMRIGSEVVEQVLHTVSKSSSLEELTLENAGLKSDFPQKMATALSENPASVIHSLNLAHNPLDNQGVSNLIQLVCRLNKGLRLLNLSKTSLSSKGVVSLSQALCSSDDYTNSLLHLDLSKNPGILSGEDATNMYLFLAQTNCLVHLDLSGTDCAVDSLFGALLRGCCADLSYLNLSKNCFSHRKVRETLPVFRQFFSSAFSLTHVNLSSMKLPLDTLRALFLGLSSNPHITDLHLDISGCELRSAGAGVLQELFPRVACIGTLDISDNGQVGTVIHSPQKLVQLVQDEECALQSLSLADSRLRSRGTVMVNALGSNACLRKVDLSGNSLEDAGAKMLSKALQINTTLRSVMWDRNNTTATGFQDVARGLEHNFTLQYMPIPLSDVTQAYRSAPEKIDQALTKIQHALLRNNQTQRFSQKQALRLHQGLVTSTAEQVMERLCVRVHQQVCVLRGSEEGKELQAARQVLKEARNSRALYPSLCELVHVLSVDGPVRQKLDFLAGELTKAADKELQVIVDSMVSLCRELCPMSSSAAERLNPPLSSISERVSIPRSTIRTALMERAAQDINRALEEVKLSVVSYLTNSIVDQILQELYTTHKALLRQVSQVKRWDDGGTGRHTIRITDTLDFPDEEGLGMNIDTIAIQKRSARTRRIRPVSTRLSLGDDPTSSPPPSALSHSAPLSRSASWECLSSLPTHGAPLRHVTHARPRPPRRHSRGQVPLDTHCSENGGVNLLEDGLPDFYTKRVLTDSQLSSLHHAQSLRRKKRRSVLSIFSGFRKNRNSTISNQEKEYGGSHENGSENVYSMIQHPKDPGKVEAMIEVGANGRMMPSPRPIQGVPLPGMRGASPSPHCLTQRQDSDSSFETRPVDRDTDRSTTSDIQTETHANGHAMSSASLTDRQPDRQTDPVTPCGQKSEPPSQSSKPSLASMRQRHLQRSSDKSTDGVGWIDRDGVEEEKNEKKDRGAEGQRPPIPEKPGKDKTSPKTPSAVTPPEETANERTPPPAPTASTKPTFDLSGPSVTQDGGTNEMKSLPPVPPASTKPVVDAGMEPDSPNDLERGFSDRESPVKKPRFPQNRNRSLDTGCMYLCLWTTLCHTICVCLNGHSVVCLCVRACSKPCFHGSVVKEN
uniref:Capping protein regulator and myosin 1 linker 3 n=1 Tax=Oncorhynchus tshawytscha TaxID=74940 RepID=A0A8C8MML7_ONCTS